MTDTAYDEMRSRWLATCLSADKHLKRALAAEAKLEEVSRQKWSSTDSGAVNVSKDSPVNEHQTWDPYYIRCLEDGDITLGTHLRREIAARLRELTATDR